MRLYRKWKANGEWVWWAAWSERHPLTGRTVTRTRSTGCSTRPAAEVIIARWERERADPVYAAANEATFGDEARSFLTACERAVERGKMAEGTLSMYRQKAGTLVRLLGGDLRLAHVDGATFSAYIEARREDFRESTGKTITESTLYKEWVTFRGILKQAWRAQRFGRDPASLKPSHFGPEYKPRATILSWEQIDRLLAVLPLERQKPVAFALGCGARRAEVFAAQAGDFDDDALTVRIRGTKTDASAATIPVPRPMRELMQLAAPPFRPWPNARRDLAVACKAAGVPVVTWNDLRRTFASLLVQAGVAPHLVAKLLRHKTTAMVDRVYGRQTTGSLADLIDVQLGAQTGPAIRDAQVQHTRKG